MVGDRRRRRAPSSAAVRVATARRRLLGRHRRPPQGTRARCRAGARAARSADGASVGEQRVEGGVQVAVHVQGPGDVCARQAQLAGRGGDVSDRLAPDRSPARPLRRRARRCCRHRRERRPGPARRGPSRRHPPASIVYLRFTHFSYRSSSRPSRSYFSFDRHRRRRRRSPELVLLVERGRVQRLAAAELGDQRSMSRLWSPALPGRRSTAPQKPKLT